MEITKMCIKGRILFDRSFMEVVKDDEGANTPT